ncbi:MAG: hypothetical protein R2873_15010 [Caldilineaceae bacterium]|nr:hypothetical protein [Caldilineaceae bacterium]
MYQYTCDAASPAQSKQIWSRMPLQPFSDILTPFSYSVLAEMTRRAWFRYYERIGLSLPFAPRHLCRRHFGRLYIDVKWICERDVEAAGLQPLALEVNGERLPLCTWTKPNLLGGMRNSRNQRRLANELAHMAAEMADVTAQAQAWYEKVKGLRWTQAEILQIMEEIERYGAGPLSVFYAARHNLERAYNAILQMDGQSKATDRIQMINNTLCDLQGLVELTLTDLLLEVAQIAHATPSVREWLAAGNFDGWESHWSNHAFGHKLHELMSLFGHWATGEGEMANPRWSETPDFLFKGILACVEIGAHEPARIPSAAAVQQLLDSLAPNARKDAAQHLAQIRSLSVLQSQAMNAFSYILAGTRLWADAAGHEAAEDSRLTDPADAFFFELEELKRMMTGEWNVSNIDEIQSTAAARKAEYAEWQKAQPGDLLFDDDEAYPTHSGLPGVVGNATGPLRRQKGLQPLLCERAVVGARQLDSGWAPTLPVAGGLLAAAGTPLDPIVAAARIWHVPTVVGLGPHYNRLVDGAQTRLDGARGAVEQ